MFRNIFNYILFYFKLIKLICIIYYYFKYKNNILYFKF